MMIPCSMAAWKPAATTASHVALREQWCVSHKFAMASSCLCVKYEMLETCSLAQSD